MNYNANFINLSNDALFTIQSVLLKEHKLDRAERNYLRIDFETGFLEVKSLQNSNSFLFSIKNY
jgi:hypothetical protein